MNRILFLVLISSVQISAQTLTQTFNEPVPGDNESFFPMDTSAYTTGLPVNTGSNTTWDFSKLKTNNPLTVTNYTGPDSLAIADYPGCTFIQRAGFLNTYFKSVPSPTSQTELLGLNSSTMTLKLSNTGIIAKYLMSFGSNITDNLSGTYTAFSISGNCTGKVTTNVDGSGTITLPGGVTLTNILRVKSVQTITLTSGFFPIATAKQIIINFYHPSFKFPILSMNYSTIAPISGTATETAFITGSSLFFVGLEDHQYDEKSISVFPNPNNGILNIKTDNSIIPASIRIINLNGELLYSGPYQSIVDVKPYSDSPFIIQVISGNAILNKLIINK
jgi:hypothetical protein